MMTDDEAKKAILKALLAGESTTAKLIQDGHGIGPGGFLLYPIIRALAAQRLIQTREAPMRNGRPQIMYSLTDTGRLAAIGESK
jgi:DNA-binding PadR family transcriptional regulator